MSWTFWTRFEWATWQWHHPWSFAILPSMLVAAYVISKMKEH